jgi:hypothetical protein
MARTNLTSLAASGAATSRNRALEERKKTEALIAQDAEHREAFASSGLPPDWLGSAAAGATAGWIFGPIGGLVGFAVSNLLQKRRRQGIAVQAQADAKTAASLIEGGQKTLDKLRQAAETDQDHLEVDLLQRQYEDAVALARNPDPRVSVQGFTSLLGIPGLASGEADEIEAAALARQTREREQLQREQDQAINLRNRLETESRKFIDAERQFKNLNEILKGDPTTLDATTAIFTFAKLVNPGEITTEGDIASLSAGGGVSQALASRLQRVILGQDFMDETIKREMLEAGKDLMRTQRAEQAQRNAFARDFGQDLGIRPELLENVLIPINTRPDQLVPINYQSAEVPVRDDRTPFDRFADETVDALGDFFTGPDDEAPTFITEDGRKVQRIDRGGGRFEWVPVPEEPEQQREPGLWQEGGYFDRRRKAREQRPTN